MTESRAAFYLAELDEAVSRLAEGATEVLVGVPVDEIAQFRANKSRYEAKQTKAGKTVLPTSVRITSEGIIVTLKTYTPQREPTRIQNDLRGSPARRAHQLVGDDGVDVVRITLSETERGSKLFKAILRYIDLDAGYSMTTQGRTIILSKIDGHTSKVTDLDCIMDEYDDLDKDA